MVIDKTENTTEILDKDLQSIRDFDPNPSPSAASEVTRRTAADLVLGLTHIGGGIGLSLKLASAIKDAFGSFQNDGTKPARASDTPKADPAASEKFDPSMTAARTDAQTMVPNREEAKKPVPAASMPYR